MKDLATAHRFFVPEVVQSSGMDCGPAALTSLLEGFGISASYGRLREACQTDVDGTSVDTLEEVAMQLGLDAEQILIPVDHVLLPAANALPALAVVILPSGNTHFVVIWSCHGPLVQLMDPGFGRRWVSRSRLQHELYAHSMRVPASAWREWAETDEARASFLSRLEEIGVEHDEAALWIDRASREPGWRALATLDAATRATDAMVRSGGFAKGTEAMEVLRRLVERSASTGTVDWIPRVYWSVWPTGDGADPDLVGTSETIATGEEQVIAKGAVLVRVREQKHAEGKDAPVGPKLSPELRAVREEPRPNPGRNLLELLRADGLLAPLSLLAGLFFAAAGLLIEALLYRALLDLAPGLDVAGQRVGALAAVVVFASFLVLLEIPIAVSELRFGRRLELRLRTAFQTKIPLLGDRYFHSRLTSDMAERNHSIHHLRTLPPLGSLVVRYYFELWLTVAAIGWLAPASAPLALLAGALAMGVPLLAQPLLVERELRVRNHVGGLSRFYLDALLGLVPM
ncbi:MAG: cysteine peptidase family C39 domain-containing protein, partial [Vicinamibacteria bacterium]